MTDGLDIYEVVEQLDSESVIEFAAKLGEVEMMLIAASAKGEADMRFALYSTHDDPEEAMSQAVTTYCAIAVEAHRRMVVCMKALEELQAMTPTS